MIYTSYFGNIKKIKKQNPNMVLVSIAGKTPNWFLNSDSYYSYKSLAPQYSWWSEWKNRFLEQLESEESEKFYIEKYNSTVLNNLNISTVVDDINKMGKGNDVCLMCYETPDKFCHRHIVSEWLNKNNIECKEYVN